MSATVITMPVIARPIPSEDGKRPLLIRVDRVTLSRLKARSESWGITIEHAAGLILEETLRPPGKRGRK
jgi:hypothetical protein